MTTFATLIAQCGLSQSEAAEYLADGGDPIRIDTIKRWCAGSAPVPHGVWRSLIKLCDRIQEISELYAGIIRSGRIDMEDINQLSADDPADPLPGNGAQVAGALALYMALRE